MTSKSADELIKAASAWWSTALIDVRPGEIGIGGYPIQDLIGNLSFAQMVWLMLRGELPSAERAKLLEAAMVAAVDHGPQAPSIAISRMAVTCGLPINGAMASAINVLDDVHGGAGQQCMELYNAIAGAEDTGAADALEQELARFAAARGEIVPGFGHRFHPVDPRSGRLLALVESAREAGAVTGRYAKIGTALEHALERRKGRRIPMNIDGATGRRDTVP